MKSFNIYFSDLNQEAQKRLLDTFDLSSPKDANWDSDIMPIATIDIGVDGEERE